MSTPLTDAINALTTYANETTGASDTDLSSAVATLVAGYGSSSGSTPFTLQTEEYTPSADTTDAYTLTSTIGQPDFVLVYTDYSANRQTLGFYQLCAMYAPNSDNYASSTTHNMNNTSTPTTNNSSSQVSYDSSTGTVSIGTYAYLSGTLWLASHTYQICLIKF